MYIYAGFFVVVIVLLYCKKTVRDVMTDSWALFAI